MENKGREDEWSLSLSADGLTQRKKKARRTTVCPEQIVHTAPRSSVDASGGWCGANCCSTEEEEDSSGMDAQFIHWALTQRTTAVIIQSLIICFKACADLQTFTVCYISALHWLLHVQVHIAACCATDRDCKVAAPLLAWLSWWLIGHWRSSQCALSNSSLLY